MRALTYVLRHKLRADVTRDFTPLPWNRILRLVRDSRLYIASQRNSGRAKKKKERNWDAQKNMTVNNSFLYPVAPAINFIWLINYTYRDLFTATNIPCHRIIIIVIRIIGKETRAKLLGGILCRAQYVSLYGVFNYTGNISLRSGGINWEWNTRVAREDLHGFIVGQVSRPVFITGTSPTPTRQLYLLHILS